MTSLNPFPGLETFAWIDKMLATIDKQWDFSNNRINAILELRRLQSEIR